MTTEHDRMDAQQKLLKVLNRLSGELYNVTAIGVLTFAAAMIEDLMKHQMVKGLDWKSFPRDMIEDARYEAIKRGDHVAAANYSMFLHERERIGKDIVK